MASAQLSRVSVFDMFRVGIGPSSSHTVAPMRAAHRFIRLLADAGDLRRASRLRWELCGSLGATGRGHGTDRAIVLGLAGHRPESVPATVIATLPDITAASGRLTIGGGPTIDFAPGDIEFCPATTLPVHPNALIAHAYDAAGRELASRIYYSVGGGFLVEAGPDGRLETPQIPPCRLPYPFATAAELLTHCGRSGLSIASVMAANEQALHPDSDVTARLQDIWVNMVACMDAGCRASGVLPGGLGVPRRAGTLHRALTEQADPSDPLRAMDWVNLWALAVNEENAAGHRVVTAPTNGSAGVIPAVLRYFREFVPGADDEAGQQFLLTAGAVGTLIKRNASIAGAEVGCQGEIGSACAMAAAGLAHVLGGTPLQVENAAEIAMEHNLGLTCDPIGGLVQIPCIERNAIAAVKAINAARMALRGDGRHTVSLDAAIETMRATGADMNVKYKETSRGGLAVNVIEC